MHDETQQLDAGTHFIEVVLLFYHYEKVCKHQLLDLVGAEPPPAEHHLEARSGDNSGWWCNDLGNWLLEGAL